VSSIRKVITVAATAAMLLAPALSSDSDAQGRRAVRRAAAPRAGGVVIAAYYRPLFVPLFYDPFYDPWWFPYRYGSPRGGYGYYARGYAADSPVRLQVSPRDAEVFVDGYYAGIVDDFDGVFQRLLLEPGDHEITLYFAGFRTVTHRIYLQPGRSFTIREGMAQLAPGDIATPRPAPPPRTATPAAPGNAPPQPPSRNERRSGVSGDPEERRQGVPADTVRGDSRFGAVAIRVQPADADVFIDGERWDGPADDEALVVQVSPGPHRIEVRRSGYRTYAGEMDVTAAETSPLNVVLPRE
jgi:hypothetical protein